MVIPSRLLCRHYCSVSGVLVTIQLSNFWLSISIHLPFMSWTTITRKTCVSRRRQILPSHKFYCFCWTRRVWPEVQDTVNAQLYINRYGQYSKKIKNIKYKLSNWDIIGLQIVSMVQAKGRNALLHQHVSFINFGVMTIYVGLLSFVVIWSCAVLQHWLSRIYHAYTTINSPTLIFCWHDQRQASVHSRFLYRPIIPLVPQILSTNQINEASSAVPSISTVSMRH